MPINKVVATIESAIEGIEDGSSILVSGFGGAGQPVALLEHLATRGLRNLTVVSNNAGSGKEGLAALLAAGSVSRIICSYPRMPGSVVFDELYANEQIELELCPQGTLTERIRAGGSGIAGFYTHTAADTALGEGKEHRHFGDLDYVLELPITADFALLRAHRGDRWGNLTYHRAARNFGPSMAMAAAVTIAEVQEVVPLGALDPETIVTPGIFVDRIVQADRQ